MKIVDSFLFSDLSERNMLLVKLENEYDIVSEFLLIENHYNFKGKHKGIFAERLLKEDKRFAKFTDKIRIFSLDNWLAGGETENDNFARENQQRLATYDYIIGNYNDEDYVIISDVDESIDFSNEKRRDVVLFQLNIQTNLLCSINRQRFWFDYDNKLYHNELWIPLVTVGALRYHGYSAMMARHYQTPRLNTNNITCAFEYSYCFNTIDELMDKKNNFSHTGFVRKDIEDALYLNSWIKSPIRNEYLDVNKSEDWFETIQLTEDNSPLFVRQNLKELKTNVVNPNYIVNRIEKGYRVNFNR